MSKPASKKISLSEIFGLSAFLCLFLSGVMLWRAYILDDAPPADHLKVVTGVATSWGTQKVVGVVICMPDLARCLRIPKPGMLQDLIVDALRSGSSLTIRYDPKSLSAWGARIYYSAYELKADQRMLFSYEEMRDELSESRHFAEGAAAFLFLTCIGLVVMAYRRSSWAAAA